MQTIKIVSWKSCLTLAVAALVLAPASALAQEAACNQGIFGDEQQMLRTDGAMINQYSQAQKQAEDDLQTEDQKSQAYRLYAENRVNQLEDYKKRGSPGLAGSKQGDLPMLESWLKNDEAYRAKQQAYIAQLNEQIMNLRQTQVQTLANLNNDVAGLRQNQQDRKDQQRFENQMQINQFNELQSETGACSWGGTPNDGTFNSPGAMGMMSGMGFAGGRGFMRGGY